MTEYFQKYLKYKSKYLRLIGGEKKVFYAINIAYANLETGSISEERKIITNGEQAYIYNDDTFTYSETRMRVFRDRDGRKRFVNIEVYPEHKGLLISKFSGDCVTCDNCRRHYKMIRNPNRYVRNGDYYEDLCEDCFSRLSDSDKIKHPLKYDITIDLHRNNILSEYFCNKDREQYVVSQRGYFKTIPFLLQKILNGEIENDLFKEIIDKNMSFEFLEKNLTKSSDTSYTLKKNDEYVAVPQINKEIEIRTPIDVSVHERERAKIQALKDTIKKNYQETITGLRREIPSGLVIKSTALFTSKGNNAFKLASDMANAMYDQHEALLSQITEFGRYLDSQEFINSSDFTRLEETQRRIISYRDKAIVIIKSFRNISELIDNLDKLF